MQDLGVSGPNRPENVGRLTKAGRKCRPVGRRTVNPAIAERLFLSRKTVSIVARSSRARSADAPRPRRSLARNLVPAQSAIVNSSGSVCGWSGSRLPWLWPPRGDGQAPRSNRRRTVPALVELGGGAGADAGERPTSDVKDLDEAVRLAEIAKQAPLVGTGAAAVSLDDLHRLGELTMSSTIRHRHDDGPSVGCGISATAGRCRARG
jgi:hypothetical protein